MGLRQTRDGTFWVTTRAGIARFDGVRFQVFTRTNTPALASHSLSIFNLIEDAYFLGLWRLDSTGGQRFAYGQWTHLSLPAYVQDPAELQLSNIVEDPQRNLWYKVAGHPTEESWVREGHLSVYRGLPRASPCRTAIAKDRLWISQPGAHVALWKDGAGDTIGGLFNQFRLSRVGRSRGRFLAGHR